jgi:hypothetical protein
MATNEDESTREKTTTTPNQPNNNNIIIIDLLQDVRPLATDWAIRGG